MRWGDRMQNVLNVSDASCEVERRHNIFIAIQMPTGIESIAAATAAAAAVAANANKRHRRFVDFVGGNQI